MLHESQKQAAKDKHRFRMVNAGRKWGKTTLGSYEIQGAGLAHNDAKVLYLAPTFTEARDIMWEPLKRLTRNAWAAEPNETRLELRLKTQDGGSSVVYLKGWETVESIRGMEFDFIVPDEVRKFRNFWTGWQEVLRPTLTPRKGEVLAFSTPNGFDHWYDLCMLYKTDPEYKYFHFTTYDNPFIAREEIEEARRQMTEDAFAQEFMADFRKKQGLVYREFDRDSCLFDSVVQSRRERILGVDFGYTNPTAVLVIDVDYNDTYWVVEEWYRVGKTNIEITEYCKSKAPNAVYPDPAEPDRIEEMRRHGLNVREVSKDVVAGIDKVRELFRAGKIRINKSCVNLIAELETYSYADKKSDRSESEEPVKERDHATDALRYALFTQSKVESVHIAKQYKPRFANL